MVVERYCESWVFQHNNPATAWTQTTLNRDQQITQEAYIMSCQICFHEFQSLCNYFSTKLVSWLLNSIFRFRFTCTKLCESQDRILLSDNEFNNFWYLFSFWDLFVNFSRQNIPDELKLVFLLLISTCLDPPSVEPYRWDQTDITKWPVSIAHLKYLCYLWLLTMFAVRMTSESVQPPKWSRPRNDPQPWNDPQIDPEMIPTFLLVDPEMIPKE